MENAQWGFQRLGLCCHNLAQASPKRGAGGGGSQGEGEGAAAAGRHPFSRRPVKSCRKGGDKKGRENNDVSSLKPLPSSLRVHTCFCSMLLWGLSENPTTLMCGLKNTLQFDRSKSWVFLETDSGQIFQTKKELKIKNEVPTKLLEGGECQRFCCCCCSLHHKLWASVQESIAATHRWRNPPQNCSSPAALRLAAGGRTWVASPWEAFAKAHCQSPCRVPG